MYFVINCFISAVCIVSLILFTEVFPKWIKLLIGAVQVVTTSYAIAIMDFTNCSSNNYFNCIHLQQKSKKIKEKIKT